MAKRVEDEPKKGAPAYMNTYGDMMTLLMTFFVVMFSMSSVDTAKFRAFVESYSGTDGILTGGEVLMNSSGMLGSGVQTFPEPPKLSAEAEAEAANQELNEVEKELQQHK